jgi:hypothetical protein
MIKFRNTAGSEIPDILRLIHDIFPDANVKAGTTG